MYQTQPQFGGYYPPTQYPQTQYPTRQSVPQMVVPTPSSPMGLKGRPVSSIEEARGATIDFDGSTFFFPDIPNQRIYTKQINMDGTASFNMYQLTDLPQAAPPIDSSQYITRDEFDAAIGQLKMSLAQPIPMVAPTLAQGMFEQASISQQAPIAPEQAPTPTPAQQQLAMKF